MEKKDLEKLAGRPPRGGGGVRKRELALKKKKSFGQSLPEKPLLGNGEGGRNVR